MGERSEMLFDKKPFIFKRTHMSGLEEFVSIEDSLKKKGYKGCC